MTTHSADKESSNTGNDAPEWRIVAAVDDRPWPCTLVDRSGRSLLAIHNGTPIIRDRALAERLLAALNDPDFRSGGES